jgi:hypothetical protein
VRHRRRRAELEAGAWGFRGDDEQRVRSDVLWLISPKEDAKVANGRGLANSICGCRVWHSIHLDEKGRKANNDTALHHGTFYEYISGRAGFGRRSGLEGVQRHMHSPKKSSL